MLKRVVTVPESPICSRRAFASAIFSSSRDRPVRATTARSSKVAFARKASKPSPISAERSRRAVRVWERSSR
jgi:hypothetical protein